ncbi:MAG TPA: N-acetyl-gamma-glutamyl-phosphate reductase [Kofleriaceae bacterium]|jgi:N-acetyl-gamma-glutamyl-phosphate reductase
MVHARVSVFGAPGYAGAELVKLLAMHPNVQLAAAASDRMAGASIAQATGAAVGTMRFLPTEQVAATAADIAMLAVPHEAAPELAAQLRAKGMKIIDLSNAHRATAGVPYGLTSWFAGDATGATLIANPGCYATCVITAMAPFVKAGWIAGDIVVAAGSGVTGAGKSSDLAMSLGELHDNVRAYKVLRHQHVPEIEMALGRIGGGTPRVILTTHLLPIARGIFATLTIRLREEKTSEQVTACLRDAYAADETVAVFGTPEQVSLRGVVGTNQTHLGAAASGDVCVITAAIDNLLKGAAGQAVENMNLMLGVPRMTGLLHLARHG